MAEESDFLVAVLRYFDGDLNAAELMELNERLRTDPDCRQRLVEICTRGLHVREIFEPERLALQRREIVEVSKDGHVERTTWRRWRLLTGVTVAASILAGLLLGWWLFRNPRGATIGSIAHVSGDVRILAAGGEVRSAESRALIKSGDTIRARGDRTQAEFAFVDGTRITLVGDTSVTVGDTEQKSVVVHHGNLAVVAMPQPKDRPLTLATPTAALEVLGTEFLLEARHAHTDLSVLEGRIRVTRMEDNKSVEVVKGKRLLTKDRAAFEVQDIQPPDQWEIDFEEGLPDGMSRGRFVSDRLPKGARGAVTSVRVDLGKYGVVHEIATPEKWCNGLFSVHEDSHLHFTYRMDRPDWINVFIITREPNGPFAGNYLFARPVFRRPADKWRTITIPLSEFKKAGSEQDEALPRHLIPFLILFSADKDRGLVIDRIRVTRGGPGVVEFKDVE